METIINFFNHPFFIIVGGIATILMVVGFCYTVFLIIKGVLPAQEGRIDDDNMNKINSHRNSVVVNFKGRLLNDILTLLITTSYDK